MRRSVCVCLTKFLDVVHKDEEMVIANHTLLEFGFWTV